MSEDWQESAAAGSAHVTVKAKSFLRPAVSPPLLQAEFAAALLALFVFSCFVSPNFSVLFFAAFIVCGAFDGRASRYRRIRFDFSAAMKRGMEIKKVALSENCTVKKAISFLERGKYLEITVFDGEGEFLCELSEGELCAILERADIYRPLSEYLDGGI